MDQPKIDAGHLAGKALSTVMTLAFAGMIIVAAGCAGIAGQGKTADTAGKDAAKKPDETQLQLPPLQIAELSPADPQPADDQLRPGLAVIYYFDYFERHLRELSAFTASRSTVRRTGKPIPYLNHRFGRDEVFDSGTNRGVAMRMRGMIRFPTPGEYTFRALSNDGLRIRIDDTMIIDDPTQHSDRYAIQAVVAIRQSGWYPLMVEYFQRKGTASIGLYWRTPGAKEFAAVPPESFAHLPQ
jgi:hypothetical protein